MKIYFKITASAVTNALALSSTALTVENQDWTLEELLPIADDVKLLIQANGVNFDYSFWIKMPFDIQAVKFNAVVTAFDLLESTGGNVIKNLVRQSVVQFQKGKVYLIPFDAGAVTNIVPQSVVTIARFQTAAFANTSGVTYVSRNYIYRSKDELQTRNAATFNGISYDIDFAEAQKIAVHTAEKRQANDSNFVQSLIL